jgi:hypothetical protein
MDSVTLNYLITVFNDNSDLMDCTIRALAKKKTQLVEDFFRTVKLARQMLSNYNAEVTPPTGSLRISSHIRHSVQMLRSFT